jgi:flagellar biosynthesis protein FlhF
MISEERGYMTISGKSLQECKEKLYERYGRDYKILDQRDDFESYGLFNLRKRPIKVVNYVVTHRKSYNTDNYFINNANEEDELEQNRQAILQANNTTLLTSQLKEVNKTLEDFKAEVANQLKSYSHSMSEQHETITKIQEILQQNEFSFSYIKMIEDKIRTTFSLEELNDFKLVERYVIDWIAESIEIKQQKYFRPPHVFIIVGPTGVGKTTTIEKLASNTIIDAKRNDKPRPSLCIITIDIMKAGALEQLKRVGEILGEEIKKAECAEDVKQLYEENKDHVDFMFIDTSGYSPNDSQHIADMKRILDVKMNADVYLSVSATTKTSDLINIFRNYEPFAYESVILTKADETNQFGNIISVLWEKHKSISYITDGQGIPRDIHKADVIDIIKRLNGFDVDRIHLEDKFGEK